MTKIIVTIGPSSCDTKSILRFSKHTKLFRLNGSHNKISWHEEAIKAIRDNCDNAFILFDIPGIKPRTSNSAQIEINNGQEVFFGEQFDHSKGAYVELTKSLPTYSEDLKNFSVNDGQFLFDVSQTGQGWIAGKSREDFILLPKKGINLPGSIYDEKQQFEIYKDFIKKISHLDVDALGLSFVQTADLIVKVRNLSKEHILISKMENTEGMNNCSDIARVSDAVMIDRGDLVAEVGYQNLFRGIEDISIATKEAGKPLIMATENLESMVHRQLPSKSEVISIAHSIQKGVDCFMLSEETAISKNKHIIVEWLSEFASKLEVKDSNELIPPKATEEEFSIWQAILQYDGLPIIVVSKSGRAVSRLLALKRNAEIVVLTNNPKVEKIVQLYAKDTKVILTSIEDPSSLDTVWEICCAHYEEIFGNNSHALAIFVSRYINKPQANAIALLKRSDFEA